MSRLMPENAIEVHDLYKIYKNKKGKQENKALDKVNLQIPRGSFFALLGPNGAGKSTFINILAGTVLRTQGDVKIWGYDLDKETRKAKVSIGIVPQDINVDPFFTPKEALDIQAGYYGVPKKKRRTQELLEIVDLTDKANSHIRMLSGGMTRRLLIAKAMVHSPPILVLDEPTAGVDVELRHMLWNQLKKLNAEGVTIILTTHYLEEAQALCNRIAIIDKGKVIACDDKESMLDNLGTRQMEVWLTNPIEEIPEALKEFQLEIGEDRRYLNFLYDAGAQKSGYIVHKLQESGLTISSLQTKDSRLEDIFLELTSHVRHNTNDSRDTTEETPL